MEMGEKGQLPMELILGISDREITYLRNRVQFHLDRPIEETQFPPL